MDTTRFPGHLSPETKQTGEDDRPSSPTFGAQGHQMAGLKSLRPRPARVVGLLASCPPPPLCQGPRPSSLSSVLTLQTAARPAPAAGRRSLSTWALLAGRVSSPARRRQGRVPLSPQAASASLYPHPRLCPRPRLSRCQPGPPCPASRPARPRLSVPGCCWWEAGSKRLCCCSGVRSPAVTSHHSRLGQLEGAGRLSGEGHGGLLLGLWVGAAVTPNQGKGLQGVPHQLMALEFHLRTLVSLMFSQSLRMTFLVGELLAISHSF